MVNVLVINVFCVLARCLLMEKSPELNNIKPQKSKDMKTIITTTLMIFALGTYANHPKSALTSTFVPNIDYPAEAVNDNEEGTVILYFEIEDGAPSNVRVAQSVSPRLDEAALKMLNEQSAAYFRALRRNREKEI